MAKKGKKILKLSLLILTLLIVGGFALNWYLTYRLQNYLNQRLSQDVANATNGFYHFSFDNLSVGLFNGELSIKGVELIPDSIVFEQFKKGDSLPDNYFDIHVGEIHFKGLNLSWRRSYKDLKFSLFEVISPDIKVFQLNSDSSDSPKETENEKLETLYQMVCPYINQLAINKINLENANVSYTIKDTLSSVIYSLKNINFQAHNFLLNENSSYSGKLLYCDNFEFIADTPQELLHSEQIILNTDNIKLSTIDSVIQIKGVHISPKDTLWKNRQSVHGNYLKAEVSLVELKGISFERRDALNYFRAESFDISSTYIQYYSVSERREQKQTQQQKYTRDNQAIQNWSLYNIVSPILNRISIHKIAIEKTKFDYTLIQNGFIDVYSLEQFDFQAKNFLVDSLSEKHKKFWYVDNFTLTGANINVLQRSNNSNMSIGNLRLSTFDKKFNITEINIKPLSTNSLNDYMSGHIKQISIDGLEYDKGLYAHQLLIESPNIEYFKNTENSPQIPDEKDAEESRNVLDFFTPYADYLSVDNINLTGAKIAFHNKSSHETYLLKHLNFYATEFLIDDYTKKNAKYFFSCNKMGLSFKDFDNLLPGKNYRLKIKNADISKHMGEVVLEDVKLIPQKETWIKTPDTYYDISTSLIQIKGVDYDRYIESKDAKISSITVNSPSIKVEKVKRSLKNISLNKKGLLSTLNSLSIDTININEATFAYDDKVENNILEANLKGFQLKAIKWNIGHAFDIGEIALHTPLVNFKSNKIEKGIERDSSKLPELLKVIGETINFGKIAITDTKVNVGKPNMKLDVELQSLNFSDINWNLKESFLDLASINIIKPLVDINRNYIGDSLKSPSSKASSRDLYAILNPYIHRASIKEFNINDANINYLHSLNGKRLEHQTINTTNLDVDGLTINTTERKLDIEDIRFNTKDLYFPIMNGFYTIGIGEIDINKKNAEIALFNASMTSSYPKMEFAYQHPKHKDWFDVSVGNIILSGVDYTSFFSDNVVKAKKLNVDDVFLQNFKNQQIEIEHNIMPLIYEGLYQLPVKLDIDTANVSNFSVIYEELAKKGIFPGKISFMGMNGKLAGLTNIVSFPNQYMSLHADGHFMGTGYFTAIWDIPVSPANDCFILKGHIHHFDLRDLNQLISPLANAEVKSGVLKDLIFRTEASSMDAVVEMKFLYNDLKINVLKGDGTGATNKFVTNFANAILRSNNPNKRNSKPRVSRVSLVRDPYHSTFNYFWQILQPPVVESVGVSQKKQNFAKKAASRIAKLKNFFSFKKKEKNKLEQ